MLLVLSQHHLSHLRCQSAGSNLQHHHTFLGSCALLVQLQQGQGWLLLLLRLLQVMAVLC